MSLSSFSDFSTKEKIVLASIILLLIVIPLGSFLIAQRSNVDEKEGGVPQNPVTSAKPDSTPSDLLKRISDANSSSGKSSASDDYGTTTDPSVETYFGPTLSFKLSLEARPKSDQASRVFVGLAAGNVTSNPQFLLSFMVDIPASGEHKNLSLAGLTQGTTYTAFIKGPAQLATSSAFTVKATQNDLGTLNLLTGDVNEDNIVDNSDYNLVRAKLGKNTNSQDFNVLYDFNKDGVINASDLGVVSKNLNKTGAAGAWYSKSPFQATQSAQLITQPDRFESIGGPSPEPLNDGLMKPESGGYWLWIPN